MQGFVHQSEKRARIPENGPNSCAEAGRFPRDARAVKRFREHAPLPRLPSPDAITPASFTDVADG